MTPHDHRLRHLELHNALDELLADYLMHHPERTPSDTSVVDLLVWSHIQLSEPDSYDFNRERHAHKLALVPSPEVKN